MNFYAIREYEYSIKSRKDQVKKQIAFLGFPCQDWKRQDVPPYHGREKCCPSLRSRGAKK